MAEDALSDSNRPYAPPGNVIAVLHRLRSRNLPERIDAEFLRDAGISEGTIHRVAFALRFLGLVEDDKATKALRDIVTSTDEEYREILGELIRDAYNEVFEIVDPAQDSSDRITNFFRRYTPASQRERMVNLFLGLCREAGMQTLDAPRKRATNDSSRPKRAQQSRTARPAVPKPDQMTRSEGSSLPNIPPALELLVRSLPPEGAPMSATRRKQWLGMAEAALAFVYPDELDASERYGGEEEKD